MVKKNNEVKGSLAVKNSKKEVIKMKNNLKSKTKKPKLNNVKKAEQTEQAVAYYSPTIKYSLKVQEEEILKYSKIHNIQITKSYKYIESAWSKKEREKTTDMLKYIKAHPEIKHIIFYSEETMCRNFFNRNRIYNFVRENNKTLHFVKGNKIYTLEKLNELFIEVSILKSKSIDILKKKAIIISENTKMGMLKKAEYGILPLKAPFGYINNPITRTIDIDDETSEKIKKAFEILAKEKCSKEKVIKLSIKVGIPYNKFIRLIRNPFYYGKFLYKKNLYKGKHIPLVSRAVWLIANKNLKNK